MKTATAVVAQLTNSASVLAPAKIPLRKELMIKMQISEIPATIPPLTVKPTPSPITAAVRQRPIKAEERLGSSALGGDTYITTRRAFLLFTKMLSPFP